MKGEGHIILNFSEDVSVIASFTVVEPVPEVKPDEKPDEKPDTKPDSGKKPDTKPSGNNNSNVKPESKASGSTSPKTGDSSNALIWILALGISAIVAVAAGKLLYRRR